MANDAPRLEPMSPNSHFTGHEPDTPWRESSRVRLFVLVFTLSLAAGLAWTLMQPMVYRSSATVLMSAPRAIDAAISEADVQNVAIQRTILLGNEITRRLLSTLQDEYGIDIDPLELRALLLVEPLADTNLVEMAAQGAQDMLLPVVVDSWISVYLQVREQDIARTRSDTLAIIEAELDGLEVAVEAARDDLESYRQDNQILSAERAENEVMARLDGLNRALNTAVEEEVKARANLETLRGAIRRGEKVVPRSDSRGIAQLENELQTLRAQMLELTKRYTMEYINKQARYRAIPERIEELEVKLSAAYAQGRDVELGAAEQAHAAAVQTVADLEQKLEAHRASVESFNRIYATHAALAEDLARLEELYRETQARLVQVEVRQVDKYPQVSVIEPPASRAQRIGPNYGLLVGGTLGGATGLAVFAVWLYGFLAERRDNPAYVTLSGVHMYPREDLAELGPGSAPDPRLTQAASKLLQDAADEQQAQADEPDGGESPDEDATKDHGTRG